MRTIITATACLALLAACSDNDAGTDADSEVATKAGKDTAGGADTDGDGVISAKEMAAEAASGGAMAMRPGQWENTVEFTDFDIPGAPGNMKDMLRQQMGGKITTTTCMTEEEAKKPDPDFFSGEDEDSCTYDEFDRSGNKMTLRMTCEGGGGGTTKVAMDGEFGAEKFTLSMDNSVTGGQMGKVRIKGTVTGRRLGDCPG